MLSFGALLLASSGATFQESLASTMQRLVDGGSWWLVFGVAWLGGLLTALTPCVYPLIPITMRYFGAVQGTRRQVVTLAFAYIAGMVTLYATLGTVLAYSGVVFGSYLASPWVV